MTALGRILMVLVLAAFTTGQVLAAAHTGAGGDGDEKVDCKKTPNHPKCKAGGSGN